MEYLTVDQAAKALGVHAVTMRKWCGQGKIPAIKAGSHWRVPKSYVYEPTDDASDVHVLMTEEKARILAKSVYDALISNIQVTITIGGD